MKKKTYIQPFIKVLESLYLLDQEFGFGSGGNAGEAPTKRFDGFDDSDSEENNVWKVDW